MTGTQSKCVEGYVHGLVQHVHLRATMQMKANQMGLAGWAHNVYDGSVDFHVEGNPNGVDNFLHWLEGDSHHGKQRPHITKIETVPCVPGAY